MLGYIVLGPDYFFGDHIQDHQEPDFKLPERRDAWILQMLKNAQEAMPRWLSAVKETYGMYGFAPLQCIRYVNVINFVGNNAHYCPVGKLWLWSSLLTTEGRLLGYCFGASFTLDLAATEDTTAGELNLDVLLIGWRNNPSYDILARLKPQLPIRHFWMKITSGKPSVCISLHDWFIILISNNLARRTSFYVPGWYDQWTQSLGFHSS